MLQIKCGLEFRGAESKTSSKGNNYFLVHFESDDGTPYQFAMMCDNAGNNALLVGKLKKGNVYECLLSVRSNDRQCNLTDINVG